MAAARAVTGEEQNNWEIFTILNSEYSSTKCSSPTIVVSDSKPVPFKPYETTKDVKAKVRRLFFREINYLYLLFRLWRISELVRMAAANLFPLTLIRGKETTWTIERAIFSLQISERKPADRRWAPQWNKVSVSEAAELPELEQQWGRQHDSHHEQRPGDPGWAP